MNAGRVIIRKQARNSLALKRTPQGLVALIPRHLEPDDPQVQHFIQRSLAKLAAPAPAGGRRSQDEVYGLVEKWTARLGASVSRVQIRPMRNKWGSISTAGTLTLAADLLALPLDLVEYVVVHELLHLKFPNHRRGWQVSMGIHVPDWRERERRLGDYGPVTMPDAWPYPTPAPTHPVQYFIEE